jgi:adenosylmethionine-8-amino-7-oxononanoate aminotransferase
VGIDEILTSYYRCGRRFASEGRLPEIDFMTLSKALSYGCFPVGAALVSDEIHAAARAANPELVEELRTRQANQLGAHFAVHAVAQVDALGLPDHVAGLDRIVSDGVAALDPRSRSIGRRFAEGLLGRIEILPPRLLRRWMPVDGDVLNRAAMAWWITQARAFVVYDVFLLPVHATEQEIRQVMQAAGRLSRTSPWVWLTRVALFRTTERLRRALRLRRTS